MATRVTSSRVIANAYARSSGDVPMMQAWPHNGLDDDMRPRMNEVVRTGEPFALVTVFDADGGPRGVGAQMVVTDKESWGFVSGGCIEADVAIHGRSTLADGQTRRLVYGSGSPWIDTRLPCGGRLDLLVERIEPEDDAVRTFVEAYDERRKVRYQSDGVSRRCVDHCAGGDPHRWVVNHVYPPAQRLVVVGSDPIALAIACLGARLGWSVAAVWPHGPGEPPEPGVLMRRDSPERAIIDLVTDDCTAIAIATHDQEQDEAAILAALGTPAGYIGVLGARRRIPDRIARLRTCGITQGDIDRLRMPIGLPIGASAPWEIALSVAAGIVAAHRGDAIS